MYFALPTCVNAFKMFSCLSTIAGRRLLVDGVHHGDEIRPTALGVVRRDYAKPMHKLTVVYVSNHLGKQDFLGQRVHTYCACG